MDYKNEKSYERVKDMHNWYIRNRLNVFMSYTTEKEDRNLTRPSSLPRPSFLDTSVLASRLEKNAAEQCTLKNEL